MGTLGSGGPGTVLGAGGAVVLGLGLHMVPTKETEWTATSCE